MPQGRCRGGKARCRGSIERDGRDGRCLVSRNCSMAAPYGVDFANTSMHGLRNLFSSMRIASILILTLLAGCAPFSGMRQDYPWAQEYNYIKGQQVTPEE